MYERWTGKWHLEIQLKIAKRFETINSMAGEKENDKDKFENDIE